MSGENVLSVAAVEAWRQRVKAETFSHYHYHMALALRRTGEAAPAEAAFRRALDVQPDFAGCTLELTELLDSQGRTAQADELRRRAAELSPDWERDAQEFRALTVEETQDFVAAETAWRRAIALGAGVKAHWHLARCLLQQSRGTEAADLYAQIDQPPSDGEEEGRALALLGARLLNDDRFELADLALTQAFRLVASEKTAVACLGMLRLTQGRASEAVPLLAEGARLNSEPAWALFYLGLAQQGAGALDEAEATHQRAVSASNGAAFYRSALGLVLLGRGKPAEAERLLRGELSASPNDPWIMGNLALALLSLERREEAATLHRASVETDPAHALRRKLDRPWLAAELSELDRLSGVRDGA